jgi:disulfide bond formation protein DsbB
MAVAIVALILAMAGTGIAASHYIITSTSQIKPSVLRELRATAHTAEVLIARLTASDIDEARAAAERLAESRG